MTQTNVAVESWTAELLRAEASRRGKTAYALANELLDASLRLCVEGGNPSELLPAWKTLRLSKDVGGMPLLPRTLIRKMVDKLFATDHEWLLEEWFASGKQLGEQLRLQYPTIEDLQKGAEKLLPLVAEKMIDIRRVPNEDDRRSKIRVRIETELTPGTSACGEQFIAGLLSAYPFQPTESNVGEGAIEVTGVYQGRRASPGAGTGAAPAKTRENGAGEA